MLYPVAPSDCASWIQAIESLAPRSERLSWLKVTWRPDWQRWCVWQMTPPAGAPAIMWGPDTILTVRVENILGNRMVRQSPDPRFVVRLNRGNMTRWAWALHLETGCYPQPFWVVQGHAGGHKWQFNPAEEKLAVLHGYGEDPPEPGSLPYAPVDRRVFRKLIPLDQLRVWNFLSRQLDERDERDLDDTERQQMVDARWQLWRHMESQVDQAVAESGVRLAGDPMGGYRDADVDYEATQEAFITSDD